MDRWGSFSSPKNDLFKKLDEENIKNAKQFQVFLDNGIDEEEAVELLRVFVMGDDEMITSSNGYKSLFQSSPYDHEDIYSYCQRATEGMVQSGRFDELYTQVKKHLGDITVLYLPTYRRIEAALPEFRTRQRIARRSPRIRKDGWDSDRLINFGLEDVESKLKEISTAIRRETLEAYSRISAETLEELINATINENDVSEELDFSSIKLILSRIGKQSTDTESRLQGLIDSREIYQPTYVQLRKFLMQLLQVYTGRQEDERALEEFANLINDYLALGGEPEKKFHFDKQKVELQVINEFTNKPLPLGALSSGEKQIVSIFARLLLDPSKRHFIIIDEPELSLSIEWQERFLTDIVKARSCSQLIAITHSPFIFKNELAPFSGSLEVKMHKNLLSIPKISDG